MLRSGFAVGFVFADYEARYVVVNFKDPTFTMLPSAFVEPLIKAWIVGTQTDKYDVTLIDLVRLTLHYVRQADRFCRECLFQPL